MKKGKFRIFVTVFVIVVLAVIIFYPKVKPLFSNEPKGGAGGQMMGGGQPLYVSGFLIKPVQMNEMKSSSGTVLPDEEVDLSFETSGKIVGI